MQALSQRPGLLFHMERGWLTETFQVHEHDFRELTVILKGEAVHRIDDTAYPVSAGDVYVLQGVAVHGFEQVHDLEFYNVMFPMDTGEGLAEEPYPYPSSFTIEAENVTDIHTLSIGRDIRAMAGFAALFVLEPFYRKEHRFTNRLRLDPVRLGLLEKMLGQMLSEYRTGTDGWRSLLQAGFTSLLVHLSRWMATPDNLPTGNLRALAETVAYLETHFAGPLSVDALAMRAHLSPRHFSRVFQSNYGMPPMEYTQRLRLRQSCDLLRRRGMSITEVAQTCGYRDGNLFTRQFQEQFGMTPTQFRRRFG